MPPKNEVGQVSDLPLRTGHSLKRILLIAKRDFVASVFRKAFLIGLVLTPLIFGGSFLGIALLRVSQGHKDQRIALIDHTGVLAGEIIRVVNQGRNDPAAKAARSLLD